MKKIIIAFLKTSVITTFVGCKKSEDVQSIPSSSPAPTSTAILITQSTTTPISTPTRTPEDYSKYDFKGNVKNIKDKDWNMSVDYPEDWTAQIEKGSTVSSIDGTIWVFIKGGTKETGYIQVNAMQSSFYVDCLAEKIGDFKTKDGKEGILYSMDHPVNEGQVIVILNFNDYSGTWYESTNTL